MVCVNRKNNFYRNYAFGRRVSCEARSFGMDAEIGLPVSRSVETSSRSCSGYYPVTQHFSHYPLPVSSELHHWVPSAGSQSKLNLSLASSVFANGPFWVKVFWVSVLRTYLKVVLQPVTQLQCSWKIAKRFECIMRCTFQMEQDSAPSHKAKASVVQGQFFRFYLPWCPHLPQI